MDKARGERREKRGVVISNKMEKTVVVRVDRFIAHPVYRKRVKRAKKYYAHHEGEPLEIGQKVKIIESRPLSKMKHWRVAV